MQAGQTDAMESAFFGVGGKGRREGGALNVSASVGENPKEVSIIPVR